MNARSQVSARAPEPLRRAFAPVVNYTDMLLFDHLFVRLLFPNRHRLGPRAWRAAQPLPYQLRRAKKLGVKTVINLRGNEDRPTARTERAACERLGLAYIDYCLRSRDAPSRDELYGLRVDQGATLYGNSQFTINPEYNFTNNGTLSPGNSYGSMTIKGNFVQGTDGRILVEASTTQNDHIDVQGLAQLDGELHVDLQPDWYQNG